MPTYENYLVQAEGAARSMNAINPSVGRRVDPQATYLKCEYTELEDNEPVTRERSIPRPTITIIRCSDRAIIMPGYYRSCARHIVPLLRRSLAHYAQREASVNDDPNTMQQIQLLLQKLLILESTDNASTQTTPTN